MKSASLPPMAPETRIAIVSGSYRPGFSYQENIWAERLAARGCTVRVFCPEHALKDEYSLPYDTEGVPTRGLPERNLYMESSVGDAVRRFHPQLVLWFGPPQRFGASLLTGDTPWTLMIFMGQNHRMQAFDWRGQGLSWRARGKALAYSLLRGPVIGRAMVAADMVVANTEETPKILAQYAPKNEWAAIQKKIYTAPLGFDPSHFAYEETLRVDTRRDLGLSDDEILVAMSSRFAPEKQEAIRLCWSAFVHADLGPQVKLLVTGLSDNEDSQTFRHTVQASERPEQVILEPFASRKRLAALFHAADITLFARPSISCQEALGTGAFGLFADDGSMDWLLPNPILGTTFETGSVAALAGALKTQVDNERTSEGRAERRAQRAGVAGFLNYDRIIDRVMHAAYSSDT